MNASRCVPPTVAAAMVAAAIWSVVTGQRQPEASGDADRVARAGAGPVADGWTSPLTAVDDPPSAPTEEVLAPANGSVPGWLVELRAWAVLDPAAAAAWALGRDEVGSDHLLAAVFGGATAADPDAAVTLARELCARNPQHAQSIGARLIHALAEAGEHERAAEFAAEEPVSDRANWLLAAFEHWARADPGAALAAAAALPEGTQQTLSTQAVISGWARSAPDQLATAGVASFPAEWRRLAVIEAMREWILRAPAGAADWLAHNWSAAGLSQLDSWRILEE